MQPRAELRPLDPSSCAAVLLAAGPGTRFDGPIPKLRAEIGGIPVLGLSIDAALKSGIGRVYVVTGAVVLGDLIPDGVTEIPADRWQDGQAASLQAALSEISNTDVSSVVVGLGDMPRVSAEAWQAVSRTEGELVVSTYHGRRRPPVKIARSLWAELPKVGDAVGRSLFGSRAASLVEVPVSGDDGDIDVVGDLHR